MKKILFVCTGNICRSSSAEAVLRHMAEKAGKIDGLKIDSAGTHGYHVGELSDFRAIECALRRGIDMRDIVARKIELSDFDRFDIIIAMDRKHLHQLHVLKPENATSKISLFTDFMRAPMAKDVPDPYYRGSEEFETVLDMLEKGCSAILKTL